jgi:hypothetical protein
MTTSITSPGAVISLPRDAAWEILDFFQPAYQLGMTATPLKEENKDTYQYFGDPLYTYLRASRLQSWRGWQSARHARLFIPDSGPSPPAPAFSFLRPPRATVLDASGQLTVGPEPDVYFPGAFNVTTGDGSRDPTGPVNSSFVPSS